MGVDGVELDIWQTRDGHIVVHHDPQVDGISIETANVPDLPNFVPTLSAALDICSSMRVNIEIKSSAANPSAAFPVREALINLLRLRSEPIERWLVSSFNHDAVDRVKQSAPEIPTALLLWEPPWHSTIEHAVDRGHLAVHPHESMVDAKLVEAAKQNGLKVNPWTVNNLERANQLVYRCRWPYHRRPRRYVETFGVEKLKVVCAQVGITSRRIFGRQEKSRWFTSPR